SSRNAVICLVRVCWNAVDNIFTSMENSTFHQRAVGIIDPKALAIARSIRDLGGRAMLVGGCVRDELMGVEPKDWDLEVYGVEPEKLRAILEAFGEVIVVGEAFAVYKLGRHLDISLPRRERKIGRGHRGFVVTGDPDMSFEEACSRRDFTIN